MLSTFSENNTLVCALLFSENNTKLFPPNVPNGGHEKYSKES
jgi:hypothetical protein